MLAFCARQRQTRGGAVSKLGEGVQLTDEQRIDWLRLIRSPNVGPRGIM
jgi:gluconate kinase